jgi:hypothetical protein
VPSPKVNALTLRFREACPRVRETRVELHRGLEHVDCRSGIPTVQPQELVTILNWLIPVMPEYSSTTVPVAAYDVTVL